jgi:hypothetical protein
MEDELIEQWPISEFQSIDLGDKRRNERLIRLVAALGGQPGASLPVALGNEAALKAAYRFFDNPANEYEEVLSAHVQSTYQRMAQFPLILAVQDTTYIDLTHHPATAGIGPTTSDRKQGVVMHSTLAITPERIPLGILQERIWARDPETYAQLKDHKQRKIEDKESNKWLVSLDSVIAARKINPNIHLVSVGDREADVYDLFMKSRPEGVDLLVRAARDRRVEGDENRYLWSALHSTPIAARLEIRVPRRQIYSGPWGSQKAKVIPARTAIVEVHWKEVQLRPPKYRLHEKLPSTKLWAVWVIEPEPPSGVEKIEWMLLTTVAVTNTPEALERVDWYACRWGIEVWHKILKSGCKIESRQLRDVENIKRLLAVFGVVAWRILYATMLARAVPEMACTVFFEEEEWQALFCTVNNTAILPDTPPTIQEAIRMVGKLGGHLGRKRDGEPGVNSLWKGFQRLHDLTLMYKILRPPGSMQ